MHLKKILLVSAGGRPRGNTAQLIDAFTRGAEDAGHQVERISLLETKVEPCLGCNACRHGKSCVLRDGFQEITPKIERADALVFASPLYYWTISARMKAFIERLYGIAAYDPAPPKGRYEKYPEKDCALLMTAADNLFWTFSQAEAYYRFTLVNYLGFHDKGMLLAGGCGGSDGEPAIEKTTWLEKAYQFGKNIYEKQEESK